MRNVINLDIGNYTCITTSIIVFICLFVYSFPSLVKNLAVAFVLQEEKLFTICTVVAEDITYRSIEHGCLPLEDQWEYYIQSEPPISYLEKQMFFFPSVNFMSTWLLCMVCSCCQSLAHQYTPTSSATIITTLLPLAAWRKDPSQSTVCHTE